MSIKSIPNLKAQIDALLPNNSTGAISAADIRTNMIDAADSLAPVDHTHTNAEVNTAISASPATSATAMGLGTANTPTFAGLNTTGNVGIGTASPTEKLDVVGNIKASGTIRSGGKGFFGSQYSISDVGSPNDAPSVFAVSGNSPNYGYVQYLNTVNAASWAIRFHNGGASYRNPLQINTADDSVIFTGNVGLGTASPSAKLDVVGNIKASGTVRTGSMTVSVATGTSSATAVAAGEGAMTYISNESGGATIAFSDGIVWRRVSDRAPIS